MKKYTEKIHAQRLLGMLKKKKPCEFCPAQKHYGKFGEGGDPRGMWNSSPHPCGVCRKFVDVTHACPCPRLGKKEAIKRTWLMLKKKGYLE